MAWFGNWAAVIGSIALSTGFLLAFLAPFRRRDWRSLGILEAFIVSLFTEMFGIPLTIYFLSSFVGLPLLPDPMHGHLLAALLAILGVWPLGVGVLVVMAVSVWLILAGIAIIVLGWWKLYRARNALVTDGIYAIVRHPQYLGIMIVATAFIIQWPTIPTVVMFPILVYAYYWLAKREEEDLVNRFGDLYKNYKSRTPMLIPRIRLRPASN